MNNEKEFDIYLFLRGEHRNAYNFMGAHPNKTSVTFRVWAPNARKVSVVGDFNNWNGELHQMKLINEGGIWEITIPKLKKYDKYKYQVELANGGWHLKSDPYAFYSELRPNTASFVYGLPKFRWGDKKWLNRRTQWLEKPLNIYEVHLGSWMRDINGNWLTYEVIAEKLAKYVKNMNYTHIEIMPIIEYPLDASWGYQGTGYYSVTSRYGTPEAFMCFVNTMHQNDVGVILDWVPGHFCKDNHGLYKFDGTNLYEYNDDRLAENNQWGTANFDLGKYGVRSFLISNALYWLKEFHIDGIRIDAVANMLYLNYGKEEYDIRNEQGGFENLTAIDFLKNMNSIINEEIPSAIMIAEDSTAWPKVTKHPVDGGLGFTSKWNMGWMNDTLEYFSEDPLYRQDYHGKLTFSFMYVFSENYILPISHDEVVHGKGSLLNKMPGFYEAKISNMKALFSYQIAHPGKKLNFMGNEIAQGLEWRFYDQIEWQLLSENKGSKDIQKFVKKLNEIYLTEESLHLDTWDTFEWIEHENQKDNIIVFMRKKKDFSEHIIAIFNFSGKDIEEYRIGVPQYVKYKVILNTDEKRFGGTDFTRKKIYNPIKEPWNYREQSILVALKSTSVIFIKSTEKIPIKMKK